MLNNIATIKTERIKNTSREIKDKRYILKETISETVLKIQIKLSQHRLGNLQRCKK